MWTHFLVKPEGMLVGADVELFRLLREKGLGVVHLAILHLRPEDVEALYDQEIKAKGVPEKDALVAQLTRGPVLSVIVFSHHGTSLQRVWSEVVGDLCTGTGVRGFVARKRTTDFWRQLDITAPSEGDFWRYNGIHGVRNTAELVREFSWLCRMGIVDECLVALGNGAVEGG